MLAGIIHSFIGTPGERELRKIEPSLKPQIAALTSAANSKDISWTPSENAPVPGRAVMSFTATSGDQNYSIFHSMGPHHSDYGYTIKSAGSDEISKRESQLAKELFLSLKERHQSEPASLPAGFR